MAKQPTIKATKALTYQQIRALPEKELSAYLSTAMRAEASALARLEKAGLGGPLSTRHLDLTTRRGKENELKAIAAFLRSPTSTVTGTRQLLKQAADEYTALTGGKSISIRGITPAKIQKLTGQRLVYDPQGRRLKVGGDGVEVESVRDVSAFWDRYTEMRRSGKFYELGALTSQEMVSSYIDAYDPALTDDEIIDRMERVIDHIYPDLPEIIDPFFAPLEE